MSRPHARLAPSSAHRWMNCPGSVRLCEDIVEQESVYMAEGTAAHALAERCLREGCDAQTYLGQEIGEHAIVVEREMTEGVQMYLDVCRELMADAEDYAIEYRLDMSHIVPDLFGTGDLVTYHAKSRRATVVDLKYGRGVAVDADSNEQLLTYALGLSQRYHNRGVDEVELIIVQPRSPHRDGPVRRWSTDTLGLYEHAVSLQAAAAKVDSGELHPGPWCKFCKAAAICPALSADVIAATGLTDDCVEDPRMYDAETLAKKMKQLTMVQNWCKRLEEFAHAEAVRGAIPPGFKLVAKRASRKWKSEEDALEVLSMLGLEDDEIYDTKMRSPAQVEKSLKRDDKGVLNELVESHSSGTSLALADDPRPSVDIAAGFVAETEAQHD